MLLRRVQATIIFKDFIELSMQSSLTHVSPLEVLALVRTFNDAAIQEIRQRPHFGLKRFEGAVLGVWELARDAAKSTDLGQAKNWRAVMATCNATYEAINNTREFMLRRAAA
jgi:hypothetical protein